MSIVSILVSEFGYSKTANAIQSAYDSNAISETTARVLFELLNERQEANRKAGLDYWRDPSISGERRAYSLR